MSTNDVVDLDVVDIAVRIYGLQEDAAAQPPADDVTRNDWRAVELAIRELHGIVMVKLKERT